MKKKDVKPFIESRTKETIYKISFITGYSVKSICEDFCIRVLRRKEATAKELSPYFKRSINVSGVDYDGGNKKLFGRNTRTTERVSIQLNQEIHEYAYTLSYAVGCSVAKIISYCIEKCMNDYEFLEKYVTGYLIKKMDEERKNLMLGMLGKANDELDEEHNITALLLAVLDDYKEADESFENALVSVQKSIG